VTALHVFLAQPLVLANFTTRSTPNDGQTKLEGGRLLCPFHRSPISVRK
jgi:hypothetical protein